MKKDLEKKNNFIHFIEKWFIIGIILFLVIQLGAKVIIDNFVFKEKSISSEQSENYDKDYIGHWYNGTFFINMTVKDNFESQEKYDEMNKEYHKDIGSNICFVSGSVCLLASLTLLIVAAFKEKKKKLLEGKTPTIIILGGLFFLLFKIIEEIDLFIEVSYWRKYSKGFLNTVSYYPEMHCIFILPILLILLGLIYRQKQRKDLKLSTKNNERIIKTISISILVVGLSFILYRFGVRIYELINSDTNIRLPFYYYLFDLPRSFATASAYNNLIILRLVKDLPVFIASTISIILFVKIILSYTKGEFTSKENDKRYKIIFILLIVASLLFNIIGIFEVNYLNNNFLYQYKDATYTIAIRSLTEPLFFGFFIYVFKHYIDVGYTLNKSKK